VDRAHKGFTLMEAAVALGVLTIGMLGLGGSFSQIVHANAVSRQKQIAILLAQRKLVEFRMAQTGDLAQTNGSFGAPFESYTWEAQFRNQSQDLGIVSIWIEVRHSSGAGVWLWSQMVVADGS
jgi:Tfp pilus assembly protein PilV